jgi:hydroxymethylpyrimidine/phosphomethylpyrimidine kinase
MMKTVLTIAGSDCSGGAGIQADIKTITAHKMYAMSAITALTAQNTMGVYGVQETTPEFLGKQLDCIFNDIRPDAVKIGMVASAALIEVIAERLEVHKAKNIVVDTVMVSTSGSKLLRDDAIERLIQRLLPLAAIITPNIPEAEVLCGFKIITNGDMIKAAEKISVMLCANKRFKTVNDGETRNEEPNDDIALQSILIKGGHLKDAADDLLYVQTGKEQYSVPPPKIYWFRSERVETPNTHGTGCTLSSAVACNLSAGYSIEESVRHAKDYVWGALKDGLDLGVGNGPLNHMYNLQIYDTINTK